MTRRPSGSAPDDAHRVTGLITEWPAAAFADLLDVPCPDLAAGEPLPLGWHWLYLLEHPRQHDLGPDGHPVRGGGPQPPRAGLRRMWAGGAITSTAPLLVNEEATRTTRVVDTTTKTGRSGLLVFMEVEHEITQRGRVVVRERQDLVYREPSATTSGTGSAEEPVEEPGDGKAGPDDWSVPVSSSLLQRFSALTYNAHRIHYDREYAVGVEGYPGLVVHGPLQAMAMAELVRRRAGDPAGRASFEYRLSAPLFDHQGLVIGLDETAPEPAAETHVHARDLTGRVTARGSYRASPGSQRSE